MVYNVYLYVCAVSLNIIPLFLYLLEFIVVNTLLNDVFN